MKARLWVPAVTAACALLLCSAPKLWSDETTATKQAMNRPIVSIPTTILLNKAGDIASVYVGARPKQVFEADIKKLLAES